MNKSSLFLFLCICLLWIVSGSGGFEFKLETDFYVSRHYRHFSMIPTGHILSELVLIDFVKQRKLLSMQHKYQIDDRVEGNWKDLGIYYKGKITAVHEDGTYAVKYAGGDFEDRMPDTRLRSQESHDIPQKIDNEKFEKVLSNSTVSHYADVDFSPSADTPEGRLKQVYKAPPGLQDQHPEDINFIHYHRCLDSGEAYSASYLTTRQHLLEHFTDYNLTWVNCEMGSFIMMSGGGENGTIIQSLDVLDFSVIHLSAFERLKRRWRKLLPDFINDKSRNKKNWDTGPLTEIVTAVDILHKRAMAFREDGTPLPSPDVNRTVVVMPFLGSDMGAGHSKLENRYQYLKACFWSLYAEFPYVVAAVKSIGDYTYARNESGLPFYDVLLLQNLPKSASLPVATVQQTKARLVDGRWDFDFIYFTESDQIIVVRDHERLYDHLRQNPRHMIIPHRLIPYPVDVLKYKHARPSSNTGSYEWYDYSCCMPRQNCKGRKTWKSVADSSVPMMKIYGLEVPLGNSNFHSEEYRSCTLSSSVYLFCP